MPDKPRSEEPAGAAPAGAPSPWRPAADSETLDSVVGLCRNCFEPLEAKEGTCENCGAPFDASAWEEPAVEAPAPKPAPSPRSVAWKRLRELVGAACAIAFLAIVWGGHREGSDKEFGLGLAFALGAALVWIMGRRRWWAWLALFAPFAFVGGVVAYLMADL